LKIYLYQIYDSHRNAILWFLEELDASDYEGYLQKYSGASTERSHFIAVCGFFELSGVLVTPLPVTIAVPYTKLNPKICYFT